MIGRCLYGVDLNSMAVELCKVSLWIEALQPGKPLSFLDHHVQQGNSLLGTTPALMARGIPDTAFDPIEGDDKKVCAALRKKNKAERAGQTSFAFDRALPGFLDLGNVAETLLKLDDSPDGSPDQVTAKAEKYAELVTGSVYENNRLLADTWCAAFFLPKVASAPLEPRIEITHDFFRRMRENPHATPWGTREEIKHLARAHQFFHWHLAFPDIFQPRETIDHGDPTGWIGGFDVVLGNPPWEQVLLNEEEWFAQRHPAVAAAPSSAARRAALDALGFEYASLIAEFKQATRVVEGEALFIRKSGVFPLTGKGRINTYSLFQEHADQLLSPHGIAGIIIQTGAVTDFSQAGVTSLLVRDARLNSAFDFENGARDGGGRWFPGVHPQLHFVLLTYSGRDKKMTRVRFTANCVSTLDAISRAMDVSPDFVSRMSPNTRTLVLFQSVGETCIADKMVRASIFLGADLGPTLGVAFSQPFNASSDSKQFRMAGRDLH